MLDRHQTTRLALLAAASAICIIGGTHAWISIITDLWGSP